MSGTYDGWNTPALYAMFDDSYAINVATTAHLEAWNTKWQLLYDQWTKLSSLRDQLVQHWDPASSPAAQAFIDRIDVMLTVIDHNRAAAAGIWESYKQVTDTMQDAHAQLETLVAHYNDPLTPQIGQDDTDKKARAVMEAMDRDVAEATANPATIKPLAGRDTYQPVSGSGSITAGTTSGSTSGGGSTRSGGGGSSPSSGIVQPSFNPPPVSTPNEGGVDNGPVLTGGPAPSAPTFPAPPASPPVISRPPSGPISIPGSPATTFRPPTGFQPSDAPLSRPGFPRIGGVIGEPQSRPFPTSLRQGSVSPDGIIRGGSVPLEGDIHGRSIRPMTGGGTASPGSARNGSTNRRLTRGATIGQEHGESVSRSSAAKGWQDTSYDAYTKRRSKRKDDPDNRWTVEEGVAPVLEAPSDSDDHSATSGVIGLDR